MSHTTAANIGGFGNDRPSMGGGLTPGGEDAAGAGVAQNSDLNKRLAEMKAKLQALKGQNK